MGRPDYREGFVVIPGDKTLDERGANIRTEPRMGALPLVFVKTLFARVQASVCTEH